MRKGPRVPGLHWSGGRRTDRRGMVGGRMNDGISIGGRLGVEAECVADRRVPPEGSKRPGHGRGGNNDGGIQEHRVVGWRDDGSKPIRTERGVRAGGRRIVADLRMKSVGGCDSAGMRRLVIRCNAPTLMYLCTYVL